MGYEKSSRSKGRVLGLKVVGKITQEDYTNLVIPEVDRIVAEHGRVRVLFETEDFCGAELKAMWLDSKLGVQHGKSFERIAWVGSQRWEEWLTTAFKPIFSAFTEFRYFDHSQLEQAWEWVSEGVTSDTVDLNAAPVVRSESQLPFHSKSGNNWLVCIDGSEESYEGLSHALTLMNQAKDTIHLVAVHEKNVVSAEKSEADTLEEMAKCHEYIKAAIDDDTEAPIKVQEHVLSMSHPGEAIVAKAEEIGVNYIVMGTRGRGRVAQMVLGSVSNFVIQNAGRPVLVVCKARK